MTHPFRPRRSVLYMPGSKPRAIDKARRLAADALILDLEDAVTPEEKPAARATVAAALAEGGFGAREMVIRVNAADTEWGAADLFAAAVAGPDAILLPKVNGAADIAAAETAIEAAGAPAHTRLWAMMETPRAVLNAAEIAAASPRLTCLVMGTNDLVKEMHARHSPDRLALLPALGLCLLAARAQGLAIIDGVHNAYLDTEGLRRACDQGRSMGFDGKTLIHPAQIAIANDVFAPSPEELAEAEAQRAAFAAARAEGSGVAVVNGRIVENLTVATAERLLAQAAAIKALAASDD